MALSALAGAAQAEPLSDLIPVLLKNSLQLKAVGDQSAAAQERVKASWGDYYPQAKLTGWAGYEEYRADGGTNRHTPAKSADASLTQLIYDFGLTGSKIATAELGAQQVGQQRQAVYQSVLLEGLTSYVNVARYTGLVEYAKISEKNIRTQTGMEEIRVSRGGGYTTDVLQAKNALIVAQNRRETNTGQLEITLAHFRNVFKVSPADPATIRIPSLPADLLPTSMEDAAQTALEMNPILQALGTSTRISREAVTAAEATGFFPRVEFVASNTNTKNAGGTFGDKNDRVAKVQVTLPFNLGLTAINSIRAAEYDASGTEARYADFRDTVVDQVRTYWETYRVARVKADMNAAGVNIAAEFLDLSRRERQLGNRSLIDVLSAETAYYDRLSDALSGQADVVIAAAQLLSAIGRLDEATTLKLAETSMPTTNARLLTSPERLRTN